MTGTVSDGEREQRQDVVGAVAGRPVAVAVEPLVARQQPVEGGQQVVVRARADLDDHEPGRGMRHEDRQQAVVGATSATNAAQARGQVRQAAGRPGPDRELARVLREDAPEGVADAARGRRSPGADS